eukprot:PITA_35110
MVDEKKDEGAGDPIKIFLEEALERQRNAMMDNFAQILQRLPRGGTSASNNNSRNATPFKVHVNFEIPIFEGQIDADVVDKWLNVLEGYFFVHDFSSQEKIIFALLKVAPHVKDWWETYCKQKDGSTDSLFSVAPTWNSFRDAIKEQYHPVESYEDQYIKWTMLWQGRDQDVPEFTNIFHTLRTKLGIKDTEQHLVLKYRGCLHKYIQEEIEFLNISSLGMAYRYAIKVEQKFKQKKRYFGSVNPKQGNGSPKPQKKRTKPRSECRAKQSLVVELKVSESYACSDSKLEPDKGNDKGKKIIDAEPNATIAITKIQKEEPKDPEEEEHLFHSQMWVKGSPLQFIVDNGSQKNLISAEVIKQLGLSTTARPQPYTIAWLHQGWDLRVSQQCRLPYNIKPFTDEVLCDITPLEVCDVLLGQPYLWK